MTRRLYNIAVVTSLVLFVVVMGLWVESGFRVLAVRLADTSGNETFVVAQRNGAVIMGRVKHWQSRSEWVYVRTLGRYTINPSEIRADTRLGFGIDSIAGDKLIFFPHWLLAILTLILPVVWLIRRRRKRDPDAVPCAKCGYDLRGSSSGACPECGEPIDNQPPLTSRLT